MAFTTDEKLSIARIVGIRPTLLDAQLTSLGVSLTADIEDAVRDELARWETAGINFVAVEPKESNFGARIDGSLAQMDIRRNIAVLLELTSSPTLSSSGVGTVQIV